MQKEARARGLMERIIGKRKNTLFSMTLQHWADIVRQTVRKRAVIIRLVNRMKRLMLSVTLQWWCQKVEQVSFVEDYIYRYIHVHIHVHVYQYINELML